jgi:hypothetical protein
MWIRAKGWQLAGALAVLHRQAMVLAAQIQSFAALPLTTRRALA